MGVRSAPPLAGRPPCEGMPARKHRLPASASPRCAVAEAERVVDGVAVVPARRAVEEVDESWPASVLTQLESQGYPNQQADPCIQSDSSG